MTMPDLGPERPGAASDTREMTERAHTQPGASTQQLMHGRTFWIALAVVAAAVALFALLLR
jgi:anti-sigma-K factor RskA